MSNITRLAFALGKLSVSSTKLVVDDGAAFAVRSYRAADRLAGQALPRVERACTVVQNKRFFAQPAALAETTADDIGHTGD